MEVLLLLFSACGDGLALEEESEHIHSTERHSSVRTSAKGEQRKRREKEEEEGASSLMAEKAVLK